MSDPLPPNITVGQAETIIEKLPDNAEVVEQWLAPFVTKIAAAMKEADPAHAKAISDLQKQLFDAETIINANAQAITNLTNQVSPLTFPVKGIQLQGTGQLTQTFQNISRIPDGLKDTMTKNQHVLHLVAGILQVVFLLFGVALSFFPQIGSIGVVGGVTLVSLISGIKNIVNPYLTQYSDVVLPEVSLKVPKTS